MMFENGYSCLRCNERLPIEFDGFVCPSCGANIEVLYDWEAVRRRIPDRLTPGDGRSDLFRYLPLLPVRDSVHAPPLRIGWTPLYAAGRLGETIGLSRLFVKDDGQNPSASFKDRASAVALARARESGASVVAAASTGNAGSSMACLAASVGMPCVVFVPESAPPAKLAQLQVFGARLVAVRGTYDQAFDLCMDVCREKGWFNRNTGYNPFTREGKKTAAYEIFEQMDRGLPDRVIVPVGDGNIISGVWKGFRELQLLGWTDGLPHVDCAQAEGSAAVSRAVQAWRASQPDKTPTDWRTFAIEPVTANTRADSIAVDRPRDGLAAARAVIESGGETVLVPDEEILAAIHEIAHLAGVFVEPSAACTWAGLKRLVRDGTIDPEERVVCLLTGSGLKDIASARESCEAPQSIEPDLDQALERLEDL